MKNIIFAAVLFFSGTAMAAQNLCGIEVQDNNIFRNKATYSVNFVRVLLTHTGATLTECFTKEGAVIVSVYSNGEVRALIF